MPYIGTCEICEEEYETRDFDDTMCKKCTADYNESDRQRLNIVTAERDALKVERGKERVFVKHIQNHLTDMDSGNSVICKICYKTIDEIYNEEEAKETPCE